MPPLSSASAEALARLRAYVSPPTVYTSLPTSRRAAVLVLLFVGRRGDLRVVLTIRSATLRNYAGQVAFPGGKADTPSETPVQTSRREAFEEIGLPLDTGRFPHPFSVEHLTEFPCSLAKTELAVRPCVAFLHDNSANRGTDAEEVLVPRLDPKEVESVFTVSLEKFLMRCYDSNGSMKKRDGVKWYDGKWVMWNGVQLRMHEFNAPVWENKSLKRYKVWGITAKILVQVARIAYERNPEFEFEEEFGDETLIRKMLDAEMLPDKKEVGENTGQGIVKGNL